MRKTQLLIELKKSFGLFFALTIGKICISMISVVCNSEFIRDFIRPMYNMVAWIVVLIFIIIDLYRELYFGRNKLILMVPKKNSFMWFTKFISYSIYIIVLSLIGYIYELFSEYGLYNLQIKNSSNCAKGILYYLTSDIVSSLCGLSLLFLSIAISRKFKKNALSYISTAFIFLGSTILWSICILNITGALNDECLWAMGIASSVKVYNQFAGIIPIMIIPKSGSFDISETISISNLLSNIIVFVGCIFSIKIITDLTKVDYNEN